MSHFNCIWNWQKGLTVKNTWSFTSWWIPDHYQGFLHIPREKVDNILSMFVKKYLDRFLRFFKITKLFVSPKTSGNAERLDCKMSLQIVKCTFDCFLFVTIIGYLVVIKSRTTSLFFNARTFITIFSERCKHRKNVDKIGKEIKVCTYDIECSPTLYTAKAILLSHCAALTIESMEVYVTETLLWWWYGHCSEITLVVV